MIVLFTQDKKDGKKKNTMERTEGLWYVKFERSIIYLSRDKRAMGYTCLEFNENIRTEDISISHIICNSYFYSYAPSTVPDIVDNLFIPWDKVLS